jgi:hypothetical protein
VQWKRLFQQETTVSCLAHGMLVTCFDQWFCALYSGEGERVRLMFVLVGTESVSASKQNLAPGAEE